MNRICYILSAFIVCISCGTSQKSTRNSTEKIPETVFTMIDSVQAQFDKIAERDSLNTTKKNDNYTDGYTTDDGETVTEEFVPNDKEKLNHAAWNTLLQKYVSDDGKVNYKGFKEDREKLQEYIFKLGKNMPLETWSKEAKLAYWINAYNAMTVDLILRNYHVIKSIKDIRNPWKQELWDLGGKWYNLDTIEHDILRKMDEPRIHFAINCASFSCPPLLNEAFETDKLERQLTQVTKAFLADSRRNIISKDQLEISKIFKWFSSDFKQNGSLIDFLNQYSEVKIDKNTHIDYKEYDWSLNE